MCSVFNVLISNKKIHSDMRTLQHKNNAVTHIYEDIHLLGTAMSSRTASYRIEISTCFKDYRAFFTNVNNI